MLGMNFNENPCDWNELFDTMIHKAISRLYILRVCKFYGYSIHELTTLFDSLIMSTFLYGIEVWESAYAGKYIS